MEKEKRNMTINDLILTPFLFIVSFIKHFLIGLKFVFFDAFYNIIDAYMTKEYSNKNILVLILKVRK